MADEGEGIWAVQRLSAGLEFSTGELVIHGFVKADVNATHGISEQNESQETHLGIVLDFDAGQVAHRIHKRPLSCFFGFFFQFRAFYAAFLGELCFLFVLVSAVDAVDFHVAVFGVVDIRIARNGYGGCGGTIVGDTDHHDGVGIIVFLIAGPQHIDFIRGEGVALGVGA